MLTTQIAQEILDALDLQYGQKDNILRKLVESLRNLPRLDSGTGGLISFAPTVKNCVTAMVSVGDSGYLSNPELFYDLLSKLPTASISRYNEFIAKNEQNSALII